MSLNEMKWIILGAIVLAALSYALGRYTGRSPTIQTQTKIDETEKTHTHQQETITEVKKPDGTDTTVTTITTVKDETNKTDTDVTTKIIPQKPKLNVSLLAATSVHDPLTAPTYGLSVSKEFLGPVTLGVFGLTNGMIGVSVGMNF
jgi:hypothetical protein